MDIKILLQRIQKSGVSLRIRFRHFRYPGTQRYWERRYAAGGRSGAGSLGKVAQFKAGFLNDFVARQQIHSIVELGCGDGDQLALSHYRAYTGLDIAPTAVEICRKRFATDTSMRFVLYEPLQFDPDRFRAALALSLEVIFHLTEEPIYQLYLQHLFALSNRWVIVFASNTADISGGIFPHFRTRIWLPDVPEGWVLREEHPCLFQEIIPSSFFVFEKILPLASAKSND